MPPLEEWFNIVAACLDATCLEAPVTMNIAKTAGYRVAMVGGLCYWAFDSAWRRVRIRTRRVIPEGGSKNGHIVESLS